MEAKAEKTTLAEQRVQKKAARRAAFIQDIAEAVFTLGVQRRNEAKAKQQHLDAAHKAARLAKEAAEAAIYDVQHPLEAAYYSINPGMRNSPMLTKHIGRITLNWAINEGILPVGTPEIPSIEEQCLALARRPTSGAVAQG